MSRATDEVQDLFRETMARVCTPVSVVTTLTGGGPHGTTVSAFASLSMEPPMVLVALGQESELLKRLDETGQFGVNILASDQSGLARVFSRKDGADRFSRVPWHLDADVPRIEGTCGFIACTVAALVDGGDHTVVQGSVRFSEAGASAPLTYYLRSFGTHRTLGGF